jgi:outer membrane protein TolC
LNVPHAAPNLIRMVAPTLAVALLAGCATYRPAPLDEQTVREGLQPPVRIATTELEHPLLPPLAVDVADGLSPDEAAVLAVLGNAELRASRTRHGVAGAELIAAGILPNPQLTVTADYPLHDDTGATTATGLGLSLELNALLTRGQDRSAAQAQLESVDLDLAWQEWQVAQEARLQTCRRAFLVRQLALARDEEEALRTNLRKLDEAADAHLVTETVRSATIDAYRTARSTRLQIEARCDDARHEFNRVLGEAPDRVIEVQARGVPLLAAADSALAAGLAARIDSLHSVPGDSLLAVFEGRRLDLAAFRLGYESQEHGLHAAVLRQFPRVGIGINRLVDTSDVHTLGPALTLDLPIFDRNQGEVRIARATREQLRAEYVARVFAARADVADLLQQMSHVRDQLVNAEQALPELSRLVDVYAGALRVGQVDAMLYFDARTRRFATQLEALALRADLAELSVGLETVTGGCWRSATMQWGGR